MPYTSDLEAAGRRAALQPVPRPPAVDTLRTAADGHRSKRGLVLSAAAVLLVLAIGVPVALNMRGSTTVQNVAAGPAAQDALQDTPAGSQPDPAAGGAAGAQDDDDPGGESESEARFELRTGGDTSFSVETIKGSGAQGAADSAAADADDTRVVDGSTVWIISDGVTATASALVEPQFFVRVEGPADQLDELLAVIADGDFDVHDFPAFPGLEHDEFFDRFLENFENGEFPAFEGLEGLEGFDDLFQDGRFPGFEGLEGLEGLDELFEGFFENGQFPDLEEFEGFEGLEGLEGFDELFGGFSGDEGCISIDVGGDEEFRLEFPEGCASSD